MSAVLDEFEKTAVLGAQRVRAFLNSNGDKKKLFNHARVGAVAMGSYARLRATIANEEALRLMAERNGIRNPIEGRQPKRLARAS